MERRKTGSFEAKGDDGKRYVIHIFRIIHDTPNFEDDLRFSLGATELETASGLDVQPIEQGKYIIDATGVTLTSDDPNAP